MPAAPAAIAAACPRAACRLGCVLFSWWHQLWQPLQLLLVLLLMSLLIFIAHAWGAHPRRANRTDRSDTGTGTDGGTVCLVLAPKLADHGVAVSTHRH